MNSRSQSTVFYTLVGAQFLGTSLWFAGNAILPQLQHDFGWMPSSLGYLTSATQLGFIAGTLTFALLGLTDRISPSKLFFASSLVASLCNLLALIDLSSYPLVLLSRCLVGFFLAGIYPVGMKIAADWQAEGLGHWLGTLVGALVLGTAFPYSLKLVPGFIDPTTLLITISLLSASGGLLLFSSVPDGPYRKKSATFSFAAVRRVFKVATFRSPATGYFGHMWELYAFWAFVPWIISQYTAIHSIQINPALLVFLTIGAGAVGCYLGGVLSFRIGSSRVAFYALLCSGICCLMSPFIWTLPPVLFVMFMIFWGVMVAGDSPQFSALVAQYAPHECRGSAITLVICIGFLITVISIQLLNALHYILAKEYLILFLAPGPLLGVWSFRSALSKHNQV